MVERLLHTQHFKVWLLLVIYDQQHRQQQHWDMYDVVVVGNIHIYMFISYITNNNNILKCCVCSHLSTIVLSWSRSQCNWQMANFYDRTIVCKCSLLYGFTCVIKRLICDQLNARNFSVRSSFYCFIGIGHTKRCLRWLYLQKAMSPSLWPWPLTYGGQFSSYKCPVGISDRYLY